MPDQGSRSAGRRILVIEDNADSAESMQMLLEILGHQVAIAHSGGQGVELARGFHPDVILCDLGLPGDMDGYDVARALRDDPSVTGALLVALTGFGAEEDRRRAATAGFDLHMTKPVSPEHLEKLLSGVPARIN